MPIASDIVTETFNYDDGRQVTVYVPPDPPEAIVFARGNISSIIKPVTQISSSLGALELILALAKFPQHYV